MMLRSKYVLIISHTLIGRKTKTTTTTTTIKNNWMKQNQEIDMLALKVTSQSYKKKEDKKYVLKHLQYVKYTIDFKNDMDNMQNF